MTPSGDEPESQKTNARSSTAVKLLVLAPVILVGAVLAFLALAWNLSPPNSFSLFCTYDISYRLEATISVNGKDYSDWVQFQNSKSQHWIEGINYNGCPSTYGTALSFKLDSGAVLLVPAHICPNAMRSLGEPYKKPSDYYPGAGAYSKAMRAREKVNILEFCRGVEEDENPIGGRRIGEKPRPQAYVVDNFQAPKRWEPVRFGQQSALLGGVINFKSAIAVASDRSPVDNLETNAPGILVSGFDDGGSWWSSPERIIEFGRRYSGGFKYQVKKY